MSHTQQDDVVYTDEPSDNSDSRAVSDQVMALASSMLAELQRVMDAYQIESRDFAQLTSLVTSTLEELDFALSEKSKATAQLEQMEEETSQLFLRLTEEREARHAADEVRNEDKSARVLFRQAVAFPPLALHHSRRLGGRRKAKVGRPSPATRRRTASIDESHQK